LARSAGSVLLIFGVDPDGGSATQIHKVRSWRPRVAGLTANTRACAGASCHRKRLREASLRTALCSQSVTSRPARALAPVSWLHAHCQGGGVLTRTRVAQDSERPAGGRPLPGQPQSERALSWCAPVYSARTYQMGPLTRLRVIRFCLCSPRRPGLDGPVAVAILEDWE
jgi:hypothetical protein